MTGGYIKLPKPVFTGHMSLEEVLYLRRSYRRFKDKPLNMKEISQLLWAAYGTNRWGKKVVPSAGATYPLEIFLVVRDGGVVGLDPGVYRYLPDDHALELILKGDVSDALCRACLSQGWVKDAAINVIIGAIYERATGWYGERGIRYVLFEVGHSGQNVMLQATALGLGSVIIGAFIDNEVAKVLKLPRNVKPLYVIPIGRI
ncbi:MAG TPA: SagB/ThcOx family dehydrogenase [Acidilobales archaeon]|nr:SagB/ThcOx family dehydrogenase [Acidilobales archaeon]